MTHKEFTPIGIYIGFLALLIQVVDQLLAPMMPIGGNGGFGWMGFLGWATYFMAGCTVKNGVRAFIGMVIGMLLSILIIVLSNLVSGLGFFATPLVLLVTVSIILHLELAPEYLRKR